MESCSQIKRFVLGLAARHPDEFLLLQHSSTNDENIEGCKKNLGHSNRLRHWSRGHLFVCRPCGHNDFSQPIYKYII